MAPKTKSVSSKKIASVVAFASSHQSECQRRAAPLLRKNHEPSHNDVWSQPITTNRPAVVFSVLTPMKWSIHRHRTMTTSQSPMIIRFQYDNDMHHPVPNDNWRRKIEWHRAVLKTMWPVLMRPIGRPMRCSNISKIFFRSTRTFLKITKSMDPRCIYCKSTVWMQHMSGSNFSVF